MNKYYYRSIFIGLFFTLMGCASNLPKEISSRPLNDIELSVAQKSFESLQDKPVRWGGMIINVVNKQNQSIIEILAKPLNTYGQPVINVASTGRFFAEIKGFVDPSLYASGREVTIFGTLKEVLKQNIGEHVYEYPVVNVSSYHLWALPKYANYPDPYWDDYYWGYRGPWLWYSWGYHGHHHYYH